MFLGSQYQSSELRDTIARAHS